SRARGGHCVGGVGPAGSRYTVGAHHGGRRLLDPPLVPGGYPAQRQDRPGETRGLVRETTARECPVKTTALRAIPIAGWLYLTAGLIAAAAGHAPENRLLRALWWIDAFLSIVVHAAQLPFAVRAARGCGRPA